MRGVVRGFRKRGTETAPVEGFHIGLITEFFFFFF